MINIDNSTYSCKPLKKKRKTHEKKKGEIAYNCPFKNTRTQCIHHSTKIMMTLLCFLAYNSINFKNMDRFSNFPHKIRNKIP